MSRAIKVFCGIGFSFSLLLTVFFSIAWWYRSQMPYNEAGRHYDGFIIWHEQAVGVHAFLAFVSFIITVGLAVIFRKVALGENT